MKKSIKKHNNLGPKSPFKQKKHLNKYFFVIFPKYKKFIWFQISNPH